MSRIGKIPVAIPAGVDVKIDGSLFKVKGPKGELSLKLYPGIVAELEGNQLHFKPEEGREEELSPFHGLDRALAQNMVIGVTQGFAKKLKIVGTGYQAQLQGKKLSLQVGFCNPVEMEIPAGLTVEVPNPTEIQISGVDKQLVGDFAARVRKVRPPEPYKGKGIRYHDEVVRRKAGKAMSAG
ncbi:MAG TPA: 50S ribosomal protein L6 [Planctomycetes bacterium]|nr:50S ribosomal protein L6 [Planctomycetota bacterium]